MNKVVLIGRVGKTPEVKTLETGTKVCSFSLATSENYRDRNSGQRKEVTEWHQITAWRGTADIVQKYVNKGDMLAIEGKLKSRQYEHNNSTRFVTEIVADSVTLLGGRNGANKPTEINGNVLNAVHTSANGTEDLPF